MTGITYGYVRVSTQDQNEVRRLVSMRGLGVASENIIFSKSWPSCGAREPCPPGTPQGTGDLLSDLPAQSKGALRRLIDLLKKRR